MDGICILLIALYLAMMSKEDISDKQEVVMKRETKLNENFTRERAFMVIADELGFH